MGDFDEFYVHTATVETYLGTGANGPSYAAGVDIACYIDAETVLVTTGTGQQVTQRTTVLYADSSAAALLTVQSRVTSTQLGNDDQARVAKLNVLDVGALMPDMAHVEATLI